MIKNYSIFFITQMFAKKMTMKVDLKYFKNDAPDSKNYNSIHSQYSEPLSMKASNECEFNPKITYFLDYDINIRHFLK